LLENLLLAREPQQAWETDLAKLLDQWVRLVLRFRVASIVLMAIITGIAGLCFLQVEVRNSLRYMIDESSTRGNYYYDTREIFGSDNVMLLGIEDDQLLTGDFLKKLRRLEASLEAHPMVLQVTSLGGLQRVGTNEAGAMEVRPYFPDDQTEQERREAVAALRSDGMYVPGLLTQDGNGTAVIVRLVGDTKADMKRAGVEAAMRATAERLPNGHLLLRTEAGRASLVDTARMFAVPELYDIVAKTGFELDRLYKTGMPASLTALMLETERHAGPYFLASLVIILILVSLMLKEWRATLMVFLTALPASLWGAGFGGMINGGLSIVASMAPMIILVLATANIVHLVGQYRFERLRCDKDEAIIRTFHEVGMACFLTTLTTLIGFTSLRFLPVGTAKELAVIASIGVTAAFIIAFVLGPALLSLLNVPGAEASESRWMTATLERCRLLAKNHPIFVMSLGGGCTILAIIGLMVLKIDTNVDAKFYDGHPVQVAAKWFGDRMTGGASAEIIIDTGQAGGALERQAFIRKVDGEEAVEEGTTGEDEIAGFEDDDGFGTGDQNSGTTEAVDPIAGAMPNTVLERLQTLETRLNALQKPDIYEGKKPIRDVISLVDIAERTHQAMGGEGTLPNRAQLASQLALFAGEGGEGLDLLVDESRRYVRVQLRLPSIGSANMVKVIDEVETIAGDLFPMPEGGLRTEVTGMESLFSHLIETLSSQLAKGFIFAAFVITLVMTFVFRSVRVGLSSMLPNILPVISGIGVVGLVGLMIDIDALFLVSVALGIAVDDTIHFLVRYRHERQAGKDLDEAVRLSLCETGLGIVRTSIILVCGFGIWLTSPYLTFKYMGLILPMTMIMAVVADMLVIPAMVYLGWIRVPIDEQSAPA